MIELGWTEPLSVVPCSSRLAQLSIWLSHTKFAGVLFFSFPSMWLTSRPPGHGPCHVSAISLATVIFLSRGPRYSLTRGLPCLSCSGRNTLYPF